MFVDTSSRLKSLSGALVVRGSSPSIWAHVKAPETALAIWERALPPALSELQRVPVACDINVLCAVQDFRCDFINMMDDAGYEAGAAREALTDDVTMLVEGFSSILMLDLVRVRLEWITGDACRKFHADFVTARVICTYVGRGTEWIYGRTAPLDAAGVTIHHLGAGDAALFKGKLNNPGIPLLHRSPPIAGTGERRLLLVISPPPTSDETRLEQNSGGCAR